MARSYGALKTQVWEPGSDFRLLEPMEQWCYAMLISQPQINNLGVLPYTPEKWWRLAAGLTPETIEDLISELQTDRYVLVDHDTGELLIRTFIKHDKVWKQPKLITNARRLIREVESTVIRDYLKTRHPWLINTDTRDQIDTYEQAQETPNQRGNETPPDTHIPTRGPTGSGPGVGLSTSGTSPKSSKAASSNELPQTPRTDSAPARESPPDADAGLHEVLDRLNVGGGLRVAAFMDSTRALACALAAETRGTTNKAGLFRTLFEAGDHPGLPAAVAPRVPPCESCGIGGGFHLASCDLAGLAA